MTSTILSGVQPTGNLHLGNYLGALKQWRTMVDENDCYFCVVDLHALTDPVAVTRVNLRESVRQVTALYVAAGIDPDAATIFAQSDVPEHCQLSWVLNCITPLGSLERMTQFKAKSGRRGNIDSGLLTYPVLMAADILAYDATIVPVGDDQRQHIELTRDLAQRFNSLYGETFVVPEGRVPASGARVMGLDDPSEKMSKSVMVDRPNHAISMLDAPKTIRKKLNRAVTDGHSSVQETDLSPGVRNLIDIDAAVRGVDFDTAHRGYVGHSYGELKGSVADHVIEALEPVQAAYVELSDNKEMVENILSEGAKKASERAHLTLDRVYRALKMR